MTETNPPPDTAEEADRVPKPPALIGEETEDGDFIVLGRIKAQNLPAYRALVGASGARGVLQEEVTTNLLNAGLVECVDLMMADTKEESADSDAEDKN